MKKFEINKYSPSRNSINPKSLIPNDIYQTFETNLVTEAMFNASQSWVKLNPEFNYYFYDKDDRYDFIKANFSSDVVNAYKKAWCGAMKADIWRYCIIYQNGGIYSDIDQICKTPIISYLDKNCDLMSGISKNSIHQSFLFYSPKNPILDIAINQSCERVLKNKPLMTKTSPFWGWCGGYTGPVALEYALKTFLDQERIVEKDGEYKTRWSVEILSGKFQYKNIKFNINPKSFFCDGHGNVGGLQYIDTKYEGYPDDLKSLNVKDWRDAKDEVPPQN